MKINRETSGNRSLVLYATLLVMTLIIQAGTIFAQDKKENNSEAGLTKQERAFLVEYLQETRKKFSDEMAGLSEAQMNFKPGPQKWSLAEIAEHLSIVENVVYSLVTEKIMKSPARPELKGERGPRLKDNAVVMAITNRVARRFQAPELVSPRRMFATGAEAVSSFNKARAKTISYVERVSDDLRCHFGENPVLGTIDGYQWLLFVSAHNERHLEQALEVKSHPGFPKM